MVNILMRMFVVVVVLLLILFIMEEVYADVSYGPYDAEIVRVIDGDTVVVDIYIWVDLIKRVNLRLTGVNTPEIRTRLQCEKEMGLKAKEFVESWLEESDLVTVVDVRPDKYGGRVQGYLYKGEDSLSEALIAEGLGVVYGGEKREPWCEAGP